MNSKSITSPWKSAADDCWLHVQTATNVAAIVDAIKDVSIAAVIPIVSTIGPSLLITPNEPDNETHLRALCEDILSRLRIDAKWDTVPSGNYFYLRLKHPSGVIVDVATMVKVAEPVEFKI